MRTGWFIDTPPASAAMSPIVPPSPLHSLHQPLQPIVLIRAEVLGDFFFTQQADGPVDGAFAAVLVTEGFGDHLTRGAEILHDVFIGVKMAMCYAFT